MEAVLASVDPALQAAIAVLVFVGLFVGIPVMVETLSRGRSLGKLALGLRVVRDDGGPVRFRHALVRGLAGVFVDFLATLGVGAVICSLLNERGKRVGDILAGTVVVRERAPAGSTPLPAVPPHLAAWATGLELSRLPADLALAARGYLSRLPELSPAVQNQMGAQLASDVARYVTPAAPPGTPAWAYLSAVLGGDAVSRLDWPTLPAPANARTRSRPGRRRRRPASNHRLPRRSRSKLRCPAGSRHRREVVPRRRVLHSATHQGAGAQPTAATAVGRGRAASLRASPAPGRPEWCGLPRSGPRAAAAAAACARSTGRRRTATPGRCGW